MSVVDAYIAANTEYEAAKSDMAALASRIIEVGTMLRRQPEGLYFSNAKGDGLPADIAMRDSNKAIDAQNWPTPEQINALVARRFMARRAVEAAWAGIPEAMKSSLRAPQI